MPVITPKNMLIPQDSPPPPLSLCGFMAAPLYLHAPQKEHTFEGPLTLESVTEGTQCLQPSLLPCLQHTSSTSFHKTVRWEDLGVYVRSHKRDIKIAWECIHLRGSSDFGSFLQINEN